MSQLKPGIKGELKLKVEFEHTAAKFGSGFVEVLSTPMLVAIMEGAAKNCVQDYLPDGQTTVGTRVDIKHLAATPIGMEATAKAELIEVDGRRLVFKVEAYDEKEKIGEGSHERFIIDVEKFMKKNRAKKQS